MFNKAFYSIKNNHLDLVTIKHSGGSTSAHPFGLWNLDYQLSILFKPIRFCHVCESIFFAFPEQRVEREPVNISWIKGQQILN